MELPFEDFDELKKTADKQGMLKIGRKIRFLWRI